MQKVLVKNTTIRHNGKSYKHGDVLELTDDEAAALSRFIQPTDEAQESDTGEDSDADEEVDTTKQKSSKEREHGTTRKSR